MATTRRKGQFWKRQTNKIITYQVSGKTEDNLYNVVESAKGSQRKNIRGESE